MTSPDNNRDRVQTKRRLSLWLGRIGGSFMGIVMSATVVFLSGFLLFALHIPRVEVAPSHPADGIVTLTGGASRISDAVELLAARQGQRLFISGVNPTTSLTELSRLNPEFEKWFACCTELGREALNTSGNAQEIARWSRERGYRSLIVVTSAWHMPRALVELKREMSDIDLIPYSVVSDRMRDEPWWSSLQTARLLMLEYVKYLATRARIRLDSTDASASRVASSLKLQP
jgi:uncharacterized SAM-binding protein YcdF (DUF218 family)